MVWINPHVYFHGTRKKPIRSILKKGMHTRRGRATFTQNPKYASNCCGKTTREITKNGMLIVVTSRYIRPTKDSFLVLKKKNRIITGWPNRYRAEQFGYFSKTKDQRTGCNPRQETHCCSFQF